MLQYFLRSLLSDGALFAATWIASTWFPVSTCLVGDVAFAADGTDWPMGGGGVSRNAVVSQGQGPTDWRVPEKDQPGKNILWTAQLGNLSYGGPVISNGLVWVGTNNMVPRDEDLTEDAGVLMCFRERDGQFLYQYLSPRLPEGREVDWPGSSLASAPLIEGDRLWFCTNRCDVVCLDISRLLSETGQPEVLWKVDMRRELGVVPRAVMIGSQADHCSIAMFRDLIYVNTTNAAGHNGKVEAPQAPSLVCFDKHTGHVRWRDNSPGEQILDVQQGSPLVIEIAGVGQVVMGQGDGWVRGFDALTGDMLWKFDINPKSAEGGFPLGNRNNLAVMPVFHDNRIYFATGKHFEWGVGSGRLCCVDPTKRGDLSSELDAGNGIRANPNSGLFWEFFGDEEDRMHSSISSVAIHTGLVIATDLAGNVHCLDSRTGQKFWTHRGHASIYSSPLIVGDKVYVADEDGYVTILELSRQKSVIGKPISHDVIIYASPIFANGTLFILGRNTLFAIRE